MARGRRRPQRVAADASRSTEPRGRKPRAPRSAKAGPRASAPSAGTPSRAGIIATVFGVGLLAILVMYTGFYLVQPHRGRGVAVRIEMPASRTADSVSLALYRSGVIERPWLFAWLLAVTGTIESAPAGFVSLRDDLTPRAVLRAIASGAGIVRATIPEGYTRFEIARRLAELHIIASAEEFVRRTQDPALVSRYELRGDTLEGFLYPDTYDLPPGSSVDEVIDRMVRTFKRRIGESHARHPLGWRRAQHAGLDERAIVTLASLVERETGAAEDRPRVAAVFWNRLTLPGFEPRLLQTDPSIVYGCHVVHPPSCAAGDATARITITRAMLEDSANTYNTYRHTGLPPGPIANPGTRALSAVLDPANTRDLYFVAMGASGRSAFATTLAEHEANVQRYLRGGRGTSDAAPAD